MKTDSIFESDFSLQCNRYFMFVRFFDVRSWRISHTREKTVFFFFDEKTHPDWWNEIDKRIFADNLIRIFSLESYFLLPQDDKNIIQLLLWWKSSISNSTLFLRYRDLLMIAHSFQHKSNLRSRRRIDSHWMYLIESFSWDNDIIAF